MAGRWIKLGEGRVQIDPAMVDGIGQCLVFRPLHPGAPDIYPVGMTDQVSEPFTPKDQDTVISFGTVESAEVVLHQVQACIDAMREAGSAEPR